MHLVFGFGILFLAFPRLLPVALAAGALTLIHVLS